MQEILERQNEHKMLEIQFAAKFLFNIAEKTNSLATYLALIPLLCLIPYSPSSSSLGSRYAHCSSK